MEPESTPVSDALAGLERGPMPVAQRRSERRILPWLGVLVVGVALVVGVRFAIPAPTPDVFDVSDFGFAVDDGRWLVPTVPAGPVHRFAAREMADAQRNAIAAATACLGRTTPTDFELRDGYVGGASAGLLFSLAIVDQLDPGRIAAGRAIAGTGTISPDGNVGPVLGVAYKAAAAEAAGADVFLVPVAQAANARDETSSLDVVGVRTLDDALRALRNAGCGD